MISSRGQKAIGKGHMVIIDVMFRTDDDDDAE